MSDTHKFLSKKELEQQEINYIFSLRAERDELKEQLNTARYFFKNILDVNPKLNGGHISHLENCVRVMKNSAEKALIAIGGDNEKIL